MLARAPLRWPVDLFQLRFPALPKVLATQLVYNLIFLSNFLLDYTKNALSSTWIQQTLPAQQPAYQSKCWQRSYPQCISQWLAL